MHICREDGAMEVLVVDAVLVSTGRTPNVLNLGLEKCGVAFDEKAGIKARNLCRTLYAWFVACTIHVGSFVTCI